MYKRLMLSLSALAVAAIATLPLSVSSQEYVAGEHYDLISPAIRTSSPGKIEVVEFFWYGCGHCYTFEPLISAWKKDLPEDGRPQIVVVTDVVRQ